MATFASTQPPVLVSYSGRALSRKLKAAGLTVAPVAPSGQTVELIVDGVGPGAAFGALIVSRRTGRVLRAHLTFGNNGPTVKANGLAEVRQLVSRAVVEG